MSKERGARDMTNQGLPWDCIGLPNDDSIRPRKGNADFCQWPLKIRLISPVAPYFHKGHLLLATDCSAVTYKGFHNWVFKDRPVVIGCPLMDEPHFSEKLVKILKLNDIQSLTAVYMNTSCCKGFSKAVMDAIKKSGRDIPLKLTTVFTEGEIID